MRKPDAFAMIALCAVLLGSAACVKNKAQMEVDSAKLQVFKPLPAAMETASNPVTEEKIALGRMLYYDPRLSKAQDVSCNTCHGLNIYGVDNEPVSTGHKGQKGTRNAPTVYNAAGQFAQFWDGRAQDVEEQAKGPILNPVEMAMPDQKRVIAVLESMPEYVEAFKKAFPGEREPVSYDNVGKAIGAFERKLVTRSRWDRFLAGDQTALVQVEKVGLNEYLEVGCQTCHNGAYMGGNTFQKLGLVIAWEKTNDLGRFAVTKQDVDKMVFKVPTLRNIEMTSPYFHDGSVKTLHEAVTQMAEHQLGRQLNEQDVAAIVTFLKALTGELPSEYIKQPALPKNTTKTPKPEKV